VSAEPEVHEFRPDWTLAPAVCLREWMREHGLTARVLAVAAVGRDHADPAETLVTEVLERKPLTELHARILAMGTGIPASFWRGYEANYRAGLAAGLKDCTLEDADGQPQPS